MAGEDFFGRDEAALAGAACAAPGKDFFHDLGERKFAAAGKDFFEDVGERKGASPGKDFFEDVAAPKKAAVKPVEVETDTPRETRVPGNYVRPLQILAGAVVAGALIYGGVAVWQRRKPAPVPPTPVEPAPIVAPVQLPQEAPLPTEPVAPVVASPEPPEQVVEDPAATTPAPEPARTYQYYVKAANTEASKKNWEKAFLEYKRALATLPETDTRRVLVLKQQGQLYSRQKDFSNAKPYYLAAIRTAKKLGVVNEPLVQAYLGLADSFEKTGNNAAALKNFKKARELSGNAAARKRISAAIRRLTPVRTPVKEAEAAPAEPVAEDKASVENIIGTWRGKAVESGVTYAVIMKMNSENGGITRYPSLPCTGTLTGGPTGPNTYKFTETVTSGRCLNSTVTVQLTDDRTLLWSAAAVLNEKIHTNTATLKKDATLDDGGLITIH